MTGGATAAMWVSLLVGAVLMLGWLVWGIREYRRTGRAQWLWMAVLLGFGLVMGALNYARLVG